MISFFKDKLKDRLLALYTRYSKQYKKRVPIITNSRVPLAIGLIYTVEVDNPEKTEAVLRAIEKIKASGKQVKVLCYLPTHQMNPNIKFKAFSKQDINLLGHTKNRELNDFLKTPFEHLYHLDLTSDPVLDYIITICNAKCKIGNFMVGRNSIFDILFKGLVETDKKFTFDSLISKMLNYMQLLQV
ncbi:hypothetical protein Aasi_1370 [Candidatus Amoebophilus asiaticus 5a2]|uniref:Uncharacterized protein n=1 Tax=Amoebophilus asiaticus (strain 5a2) TaxID=452471 RepID=B3ETX2_AMOA5|nr:hypothetical protein [Candidatus Amoebophilus asiaticus]ACE06674.1 hypothetical protein Aasi_1370 [Candidatus Amoebophilus asiaticus 5a2]